MAGEAKPTDSPAPAAPAVAVAPPAPSSDSPPAAVPAAAIPEAPAPAVEAAAPEAAKPADGPAPTLLQKFDAEAAAKPVEAQVADPAKPPEDPSKPVDPAKPADKPAEPKPGDAKPAEAKPGEKPAEAKPAEPAKLDPVAYEYAVPEGLQLDDARKGELHAALDAFRADPIKGAQGLMDLHHKAGEELKAALDQNQRDVWNDTRKGWQTDVLADEQIGGSSHQTAMGAIARMRDMFVPEKDRASFESFLQVTGAGDHPAFLKMLHNAARFYDEPAMPPANVKPSPTNGQQPGRRATMYDHPRSHGNRQQ